MKCRHTYYKDTSCDVIRFDRWLFLFCRFVSSPCELYLWLFSTCYRLIILTCLTGSPHSYCSIAGKQVELTMGQTWWPQCSGPAFPPSWWRRDRACWLRVMWPGPMITSAGTTLKAPCWGTKQVWRGNEAPRFWSASSSFRPAWLFYLKAIKWT